MLLDNHENDGDVRGYDVAASAAVAGADDDGSMLVE